MAGRLRGKRWLVAGRGKLGRILTTRYEAPQTRRFIGCMHPGDAVVDVGANAGYYTLLGAVLVGASGTVLAVEPDPRACSFLRRHVALNRLTNVTIVEAAASNANGAAPFAPGAGGGALGHLAEPGSPGAFAVATVRLDDLLNRRSPAPAVVKIDVEGREQAVLHGAEETLPSARPVVFLSISRANDCEPCLSFLARLGYDAEPIAPQVPGFGVDLHCRPR